MRTITEVEAEVIYTSDSTLSFALLHPIGENYGSIEWPLRLHSLEPLGLKKGERVKVTISAAQNPVE